ncbi:hypothetical protein ALC56_02513 [Trachymyrmex septentrionalis]|uniref:Uncharacterized protein n=1 Tax=Trachymyrmex septentrionalis TaxID=34720 RepID=A0A151K3S8_9HYME|nr:hypothetical protein ALC56_02513 [Trachymyrmex septentrionalis]
MERLLTSVEAEAASVGLWFNPAKCTTLHISAGNGGMVLPTSFRIQGGAINPLAEGESYTHLGVPTGFSVDQTPYAAVGDIVSDLSAIDRSLLAPWQKVETLDMFILVWINCNLSQTIYKILLLIIYFFLYLLALLITPD